MSTSKHDVELARIHTELQTTIQNQDTKREIVVTIRRSIYAIAVASAVIAGSGQSTVIAVLFWGRLEVPETDFWAEVIIRTIPWFLSVIFGSLFVSGKRQLRKKTRHYSKQQQFTESLLETQNGNTRSSSGLRPDGESNKGE